LKASQTRTSEKGSALIMALVFVFVTTLVVAAMLPLIETNLRVSTAVRAHTDQLFAADAGVEHVLEQLRLDRTSCPIAGSTGSFPDLTINGRLVHLSCETISGSSSGAEGWAIIATGTGPTGGISTQSGSSKSIEGPVFAARIVPSALQQDLDVEGDVVEQAGNGCTVGASSRQGVVVSPSPPFGYSCVSRAIPMPAHALPAVPPAAPAPVSVVTSPGQTCRVFFPGTYTDPIAFSGDHYFRSGTYYFQNVDLSINGRVIGGERGTLETRVNSGAGPCDAYDEDSPTDNPGTGVQWILGGTSKITVGNGDNLELYSRAGGSEPQSGISLHAVTAAEAGGGYLVSAPSGNTLIDIGSGAHVQATFHGIVFAPGLNINSFATNASEAQFQGGLVVGHIDLQSSASASGLVVSADEAAVVRQVVIRAVAEGTGSLVDVTSTAVVSLGNDDPRTFTIESWRTARST
jgi:Tfp pilus assembly protein PilX